MTGSTRAALIVGAGELEFREFPARPVPPGCVTVDVVLCGICGTEISSFRTGSVHSPAVCGHEWTGVLSAVGDGVVGLAEGDRVVASVPPPCGVCVECRAGYGDFCASTLTYGRGRDALAPPHGAFARSLTVAAERVVRTHPGLSDTQAAQIEPASVSLHGVRRSRIGIGDSVVVQGAGSIGLLTMQFARAAGAATAVVIEPSADRRALAGQLGADIALAPGEEAEAAVLELTGGMGADIVYECVGRPELIQTAVNLTRRGGTTLLLGYAAESAVISPSRWLAREATVIGSVAFGHDDVIRAMALVAAGRVDVTALHSRTVALADLEATLTALAAGTSTDLKVLVDPTL